MDQDSVNDDVGKSPKPVDELDKEILASLAYLHKKVDAIMRFKQIPPVPKED